MLSSSNRLVQREVVYSLCFHGRLKVFGGFSGRIKRAHTRMASSWWSALFMSSCQGGQADRHAGLGSSGESRAACLSGSGAVSSCQSGRLGDWDGQESKLHPQIARGLLGPEWPGCCLGWGTIVSKMKSPPGQEAIRVGPRSLKTD